MVAAEPGDGHPVHTVVVHDAADHAREIGLLPAVQPVPPTVSAAGLTVSAAGPAGQPVPLTVSAAGLTVSAAGPAAQPVKT